MVHSVTSKEDFDAQLAAAGEKLVIVDFYATWCGPCKVIAPKLEALGKEMSDVVILKVDVDECEDVAMTYKISCMPTFLFFKNGQKVDDFSGANYEKLVETVKKHR
ncbi:thioredoxin-2 [Hyalella azteca]|uniref:Thioredoxin n=1 Tax=Hyalella azteca TaxID=294128 RepID=A0A8B7N277_HYAAZ|nr:thioredoxin-2 [Hyalella azteca]